ncbi:MAG: sulfotransferase [Bacteroidales bacterium]|nr:sulfotransferase [Bacteroidales bacterium]
MITQIQTLRILFKIFGYKIKYLIIPIYRFSYTIIRIVGELFDYLFYYKYKKTNLSKPVFLIGHPRSGTTFLHKFILKNCTEFKGMYLWEMIFPALSLRWLIKPILPFLVKIFPQNIYDPNIHKTGLDEAETDDAALFFKSFEGMFYWLYFSAWENFESFDKLKEDLIKKSKLKKVIKYLEILHKKNLYSNRSKKRIFSKSFSLIMNIEELLSDFNDAKIIILLRDPTEVIPSSISLANNVQESINNIRKISKQKRENYYRNLYHASLSFFKFFDDQITENVKLKESILLISHKELKEDFENTMNKICEYCKIEKTSELLDAVKKQAAKQPNFKGKHVYSLEEFGFSVEQVKKDFHFLYTKYNL